MMAESSYTFATRTRTLRTILGTLAGVVTILVLLGILLYLGRPEAPAPVPGQLTPEQKLADQRASDAQALTTYGWADKAKGKVRIPVEAAMDLVVKEGLPPTTLPAN